MRRGGTGHWRLRQALTLILSLALSVALQNWAVSYDAAALAAVVAEHEAEIAAHGHIHGDHAQSHPAHSAHGDHHHGDRHHAHHHHHAHGDADEGAVDLERHALDQHWIEIADTEQSSAALPPTPMKIAGRWEQDVSAPALGPPRDAPLRTLERPPQDKRAPMSF